MEPDPATVRLNVHKYLTKGKHKMFVYSSGENMCQMIYAGSK
jgi:hypothetical protein